jgi:adenine-specific DNA-methyltransferase
MARAFQPALFELPAPAPPTSLGDRLRALALIANAACIETACMVAQEAALGWWDATVAAAGGKPDRVRPVPSPLTHLDLPAGAIAKARALGSDIAALPVIEASALLGRLYTQALPGPHRTAHGIFYTPPILVDRLLNKAEVAGHDWATERVLDPACGAGAFLVQVAERTAAAMSSADPAILLAGIASRLTGWDLDPFAAWLAQLATEAVLLPHVIASGRRLRSVVEVADAFAVFPASRESWGLVVGNPPFGKVKDTPYLRARFGRSLHGHPNLYGMFLDTAVHLAKPNGGMIAFLTPPSFLAGQYFRNLRRLLREQASPVSIDLVESRADVFDDVLQEVALSVFKRGRQVQPAQCAAVHVVPTGIRHTGIRVEPTGPLILPADPYGPWTLARSANDSDLVAKLRAMPARLADWGYQVSTGPLVWNRHKLQLHDTLKPGRVPVVWAESVTPDGRFALKATKRNHRAWFTPRGADDPNIVDRRCVLVQRTTAKEQHRRLIAAEMPASLLAQFKVVTVENHLNMVRTIGRRPKVPLHVLAAFLATDTADRVLRCINASVAVSASELESMPLPTAESVVAAMGKSGFDQAIRRLYGLGAT